MERENLKLQENVSLRIFTLEVKNEGSESSCSRIFSLQLKTLDAKNEKINFCLRRRLLAENRQLNLKAFFAC